MLLKRLSKVRMSELEAKRRNRRESHQLVDGMVSLNTADTKHKVVIDNNFNARNLSNLKNNENDSPRKETTTRPSNGTKEEVEKKNKVNEVKKGFKETFQNQENVFINRFDLIPVICLL